MVYSIPSLFFPKENENTTQSLSLEAMRNLNPTFLLPRYAYGAVSRRVGVVFVLLYIAGPGIGDVRWKYSNELKHKNKRLG